MPQVISCPACGKTLRIPDDKLSALVRCPQCEHKFRASSSSSSDSPRAEKPSKARRELQVDTEEDFSPQVSRPRNKSAKKPAPSGKLQPFLRRWFIALGSVLAVASALGVGGLYSEPLAITACMICIVATVLCSLSGTIWMVIDFGRMNFWHGVMVALVPAVGPALAYRQKGPGRKGAIVFISMIAPTLLLGLMTLVFLPMYSPEGQRASRTNRWENLIERLDQQVKPETPIVTVIATVASRPGSLDGIEADCEALLLPFKSYVAGSLRIDAPNRQITYQYRGAEPFALLFASYLGSATGAFIPQTRIDTTPLPVVQPAE